jgi:hypothetical protein
LELTEEDIYPLEDVIAFIDEDNSAIKNKPGAMNHFILRAAKRS